MMMPIPAVQLLIICGNSGQGRMLHSAAWKLSKKADAALKTGDDYQIIFLDWRMSDLEGTDTAREIRSIVGEEVPILIISAYDWSGIEKDADEAGINGFIQKPFFKSTIYHNIQKYYLHCNQGQPVAASEQNVLLGKKHFTGG